MADLSITNVINISVAASQAGVGAYNTSNLALFTHEAAAGTFGALGYKIYSSPAQVGIDFGTASQTFQMANAVFSQKPNILAGNGYLVVIPMLAEVQDFALSAVAASGTFQIVFSGGTTAAINWNDSLAVIQTKVQVVAGLSGATVSGSIVSKDLQITFSGAYGAQTLSAIAANSLQTGGAVPITFVITKITVGEAIGAAVTRASSLVQFFGIMGTLIFTQADMLAAAAIVQPLNKIAGFVSRTQADIAVGGMLDLLRSGSFTQSRGLYYGGATDASALLFLVSYMSRGLSTNFSGSNTTSTMNLKDLVGVQPDPAITATTLALAQAAGADVYISLQGVPKVLCSGLNAFFDSVYNLQWFVGALQVSAFNYLAQSATKIPQTENGMDGLKASYRNVCEQAVTNQYSAPGTWASSTTFGSQADFLANITQRGYYIYSLPVSQQLQVDRAARKAPLVQIALKEAGAVHSSSVVIFVNA
jgi:hypothetical protein